MQNKIASYIRKYWFWLLVNAAVFCALIWLAILVWEAPNSAQIALFDSAAMRRPILYSGKTAMILLLLSLACTPLSTILGFRKAISVRKSLGLWAFGFALFHALYLIGNKAIFYDIEAWKRIWQVTTRAFTRDVWGKMPYARAGAFAVALLLPLALTSNRFSMRLLKQKWKRLHKLVYLAVPVVLWHYVWRIYHMHKWGTPLSDVDHISWWQPILLTSIAALLLLVRVPKIRNAVKRKR